MIEPYNLQNEGLTIIFKNLLKNTFYITTSFIVLWICISLIIWLVGSKIKSEKIIKFGIKSFITSLLLILFTLLIPIVTNLFN